MFDTLSFACNAGSDDTTSGRSFLRVTELSWSTSGCGNRCATVKPRRMLARRYGMWIEAARSPSPVLFIFHTAKIKQTEKKAKEHLY
jgi:hypothetical protein